MTSEAGAGVVRGGRVGRRGQEFLARIEEGQRKIFVTSLQQQRGPPGARCALDIFVPYARYESPIT
jgi:hypothetical protein